MNTFNPVSNQFGSPNQPQQQQQQDQQQSVNQLSQQVSNLNMNAPQNANQPPLQSSWNQQPQQQQWTQYPQQHQQHQQYQQYPPQQQQHFTQPPTSQAFSNQPPTQNWSQYSQPPTTTSYNNGGYSNLMQQTQQYNQQQVPQQQAPPTNQWQQQIPQSWQQGPPQQQQQSIQAVPMTGVVTSQTPFVPNQQQQQQQQQLIQQPVTRPPKIDSNQMPSPAKRAFPDFYAKQLYNTSSQSEDSPPTSTSRFVTNDQGNCGPKFIRPTITSLPSTQRLLTDSGIVMGAIIQPLAELDEYDQPNAVPAVDFGENDVIRCSRCRAYINPFAKFIDNGKNFICNFCGCSNELPRWYMCNLDGFGVRRDLDQRPELKYGSVDLIVRNRMFFSDSKKKPDEFDKTATDNKVTPAPLSYVFVIDVGTSAKQQGITQTVIAHIKRTVKELAETHRDCKVAFITFGSHVHFYNVKPNAHPQIMVVGDVNDVFLPFPETNMLTFGELAADDEFIDKLATLTEGITETQNVMGSAIVAAAELLAEVGGGRILFFSSRLADHGQGSLNARNDFKVYGTPKEKTLFSPLLGFYKNFATTMARYQICLDLFLFPTTFMETSTLGAMTNNTGGHMYLYNNFNLARDSHRLYLDIHRNLSRETGFDAVLKLRTSAGLSVRRYFGNFHNEREGDMDLAGVDADTAFGVELKHDSNLDEKIPNYIQAAMLYTARDGTRRLRIHTLLLKTVTNVSQVFKKADLDAVLNIHARLIVNQVLKNKDSLETVRQLITDQLVSILANYRKHCSNASSSGQLILPDALKLLPVYMLGLMKSPALRHGTDVLLDERICNLNQINEMGAHTLMLYCYPQLFELTNMGEPLVEDTGAYPLPPLISLSSSRIRTDQAGIYLLNDGINIYFWVAKDAPASALSAIFNVDSFDSITLETQPNPNLNDPIGARVAQILAEIRKKRTRNGHIRVMKSRDPSENAFFARLIEDKSSTAISYVDYLCSLHRDIQARLS